MMECTAKTEKEMREEKDPWPQSAEDLMSYVESLVHGEHDYGSCVYAMSLAAIAAFNYVAHVLGVTGFQAGCASLDFVKRSRSYDGPFMIVNTTNHLYPQYDLRRELETHLRESDQWLAQIAKKKLGEAGADGMHPEVRKRMEEFAARAKEDGE